MLIGFLNTITSLLKLLPPTEGVFKNHFMRSLFATIVNKTSHIAKLPVLRIEHVDGVMHGNC